MNIYFFNALRFKKAEKSQPLASSLPAGQWSAFALSTQRFLSLRFQLTLLHHPR
jgi:hypothetical protein